MGEDCGNVVSSKATEFGNKSQGSSSIEREKRGRG